MKHFWIIAVCFVGGLASNARLHAEDAVLKDNPYAVIAARNVFGLDPVPVAVTNQGMEGEAPPKIIPCGIITIFGTPQVLFKISGISKPGQLPKEETCLVSEGQQKDGIEATRIDIESEAVTFNNHGIVQKIFLPYVANRIAFPPTVFAAAPKTTNSKPSVLTATASGN